MNKTSGTGTFFGQCNLPFLSAKVLQGSVDMYVVGYLLTPLLQIYCRRDGKRILKIG